MSNPLPRPAPSRRARIAMRLEEALWIVAGAALGLAAWMVCDAWLFQRRASHQLEASWRSPAVERRVDHAVVTAPTRIAAGTPLARIAIPRLGVDAVVAEGVDDDVLRRAVGHLPSSALPGADGNIALAGHRDTFLRALGEIRSGDRVELESAAGRSLYEVEWAAVVEPSEVELAADSGYPALTLVTCYPFRYVGPAPYRFVVRARRVAAPKVDAPSS